MYIVGHLNASLDDVEKLKFALTWKSPICDVYTLQVEWEGGRKLIKLISYKNMVQIGS